MKLPNFRQYDTQATFGALLGVFGLMGLAVLTVVTFRNFNTKQGVIWFNPSEGFGRYREMIILSLTAITALIGIIGGALGFNSLGQKRNNKQGLSWTGMMLGAFATIAALVVLFAWLRLKMAIIK